MFHGLNKENFGAFLDIKGNQMSHEEAMRARELYIKDRMAKGDYQITEEDRKIIPETELEKLTKGRI